MHEHDFIAVLETLPDLGARGVILTNTTIKRPQNLTAPARGEAGGAFGAPLLWASTEWLVLARRYLGADLVLVGVGGLILPPPLMLKFWQALALCNFTRPRFARTAPAAADYQWLGCAVGARWHRY